MYDDEFDDFQWALSGWIFIGLGLAIAAYALGWL